MKSPENNDAIKSASAATEAIRSEELLGVSYLLWGRLSVLTVFAVWVLLTIPFERSGLYLLPITAFAILSTLHYFLARKGLAGTLAIVALLAIEVTALSYMVVIPLPFEIDSWTPQLNLRLPGFLYLGVFLVAMGLSYSPFLVIWTGIVSIIAWSAGYFYVANLPETILMWPLDLVNESVSSEEFIDRYLDPRAIRPNYFVNQIAFLFAITIVLALTVWRSRRLVHRVLSAEWQKEEAILQQRFIREMFGKFVPGTVVSQILNDRGQLLPQKRLATVLFADLEGFTKLSERVSPETLMHILNEYFEEAGAIVTAHGGTITQFQGDALLASFNVLLEDKNHAYQAVQAAMSLVSLTGSRKFAGEALGVRVGINTGDVAAGAVGSINRLSYTIHGDCVNVAARLEQFNKKTGTRILMTEDTANQVRDTIAVDLVGEFEVRGVSDPMKLFTNTQP